MSHQTELHKEETQLFHLQSANPFPISPDAYKLELFSSCIQELSNEANSVPRLGHDSTNPI